MNAAAVAVLTRPSSSSSTTSVEAAALSYAALDYPVFLLAARSKVPLKGTHGLKDATTDAAEIRRLCRENPRSNLAIRTGDGIMVLEIDPRHGGDKWLAANQHRIPQTVTARSGGGGLHFYLKVTAGVKIKCSDGEIAPGVDIRGEGGYIVACPSIHPNGNPYTWEPKLSPHELELADAPAWLVEAACKVEPVLVAANLQQRDGRSAEQENRPNPELLVRQALDKAGASRHDAGLWLACQLRDNDYSENEALSIMGDYHQRAPSKDHTYPWRDCEDRIREAYSRPARQPWAPKRAAKPAPAESAAPDEMPGIDPNTGELVNAAALVAWARQMKAERDHAEARAQAAEAKAVEAERTARYMREALKIPNVLAGVRNTLPFLTWQYQQRLSCGQADRDGWIQISLQAVATSMAPEELTDKERAARAEQVGRHLADMEALGWYEKKGTDRKIDRPMIINGHPAYPLYIRPKHPAVLDNPAALPYPPEKKARERRQVVCPKCGSTHCERLVLYRCHKGHVFEPPEEEEATDPQIADQSVGSASGYILDPQIADQQCPINADDVAPASKWRPNPKNLISRSMPDYATLVAVATPERIRAAEQGLFVVGGPPQSEGPSSLLITGKTETGLLLGDLDGAPLPEYDSGDEESQHEDPALLADLWPDAELSPGQLAFCEGREPARPPGVSMRTVLAPSPAMGGAA